MPFPPPGDLPNPGIEPGSPAFQADTLLSKPIGASLVAQRVKQLPAMREAPRSLIYLIINAFSLSCFSNMTLAVELKSTEVRDKYYTVVWTWNYIKYSAKIT